MNVTFIARSTVMIGVGMLLMLSTLSGPLHRLLGFGNIQHELDGTGDFSGGVLDRSGRVSNREGHPRRIGNGFPGEHAVLPHGLGTPAFRGPAVRRLEQIVALSATHFSDVEPTTAAPAAFIDMTLNSRSMLMTGVGRLFILWTHSPAVSRASCVA